MIPDDQSSLASASTLSVVPGGAPFNVAIALKRLGFSSVFAGALSIDDFGNRLRNTLDREAVEYVPRNQIVQPTRLAVINPYDQHFRFRFYGDETADTQLKTEQLIPILDSTCAALYLSSLMFHHPLASRVQQAAISMAVEHCVPIYSDPNPRLPLWRDSTTMGTVVRRLLSVSSVAKLSLDDAMALGWSINPEVLIRDAKSEWDTTLIVTDGENGSWAQIGETIVHVPTVKVDLVDSTGAGDSFFAALIAEHLRTRQLTEQELSFANHAGALATTKQGAIPGLPFRVEVEAYMRSTS